MGATLHFLLLPAESQNSLLCSIAGNISLHAHHHVSLGLLERSWPELMNKLASLASHGSATREGMAFMALRPQKALSIAQPSSSPTFRVVHGYTSQLYSSTRVKGSSVASGALMHPYSLKLKRISVTMLAEPVARCLRILQHRGGVFSTSSWARRAEEWCNNAQWNLLRPAVQLRQGKFPPDNAGEHWGTTPTGVLSQFAVVMVSERIMESLAVLQLALRLSIAEVATALPGAGAAAAVQLHSQRNSGGEDALQSQVAALNALDSEMHCIASLALDVRAAAFNAAGGYYSASLGAIRAVYAANRNG